MGQHLVLSVRFHGDAHGTARYHGMALGRPEWPPSPARVYQALVAGVARGGKVPASIASALEWLEQLPPPTIAAPRSSLGSNVQLYVPNNDADTLEDPRDVGSIRTKKLEKASLFHAADPVLYAWSLSAAEEPAKEIAQAADWIYQLGRGRDMAWAVGEIVDDATLESQLREHPGHVLSPEPGHGGRTILACPTPGSLASLDERHHAVKLRVEGTGKAERVLFTNPPKPRFSQVSYDAARADVVFELVDRDLDTPWPWSLTRAAALVESVRDRAAERLRRALPDSEEIVDGTLIGRRPNDVRTVPIDHRVRILPLPSIGFEHADRGIRRLLVQIPSRAPLAAADIEWAFSGLEGADAMTGELSPWVVTRSFDTKMRDHYIGPSRLWRSVTPVALPEGAQRRRIEPVRRREEAKAGGERQAEDTRAVASVHTALRQAGVRRTAVRVRVQREPFEGRGARAELFADGTRFAKERLWHVELELDEPVHGPLAVGDGRFLGLGLLAPVRETADDRGVHVFAVAQGVEPRAPAEELTRALRRAVMARAQQRFHGSSSLPTFFTGHEADGAPARAEHAGHVAFAFEPESRRLYIFAPHALDRRDVAPNERAHVSTLGAAVTGFVELRAGKAGRLDLREMTVDRLHDDVLGASRCWTSAVPYVVTRHARKADAKDVLMADIRAECRRANLPPPVAIRVRDLRGIPRVGLVGMVDVEFAVEISGPVLLGRNRYFGGGLFRGVR